jgi:hypothetical protein
LSIDYFLLNFEIEIRKMVKEIFNKDKTSTKKTTRTGSKNSGIESLWSKRSKALQEKIDSLIQLKSILSRLEEFQKLEQNWDGYNADPISNSVLEFANNVAKYLIAAKVKIDFCVPMRNGGVQFEFNLGNDCEIEVHPNGDIYFLTYDNHSSLTNKELITIEQLKKHAW